MYIQIELTAEEMTALNSVASFYSMTPELFAKNGVLEKIEDELDKADALTARDEYLENGEQGIPAHELFRECGL